MASVNDVHTFCMLHCLLTYLGLVTIYLSSVNIDEDIYTSGAAVTIPGLTFGCSDADGIDSLTYSLTSGSTTIWDVTAVPGSLQ